MTITKFFSKISVSDLNVFKALHKSQTEILTELQKNKFSQIAVFFLDVTQKYVIPTMGELDYSVKPPLVHIKIPYESSFILTDDSIYLNRITNELSIFVNANYPYTISKDDSENLKQPLTILWDKIEYETIREKPILNVEGVKTDITPSLLNQLSTINVFKGIDEQTNEASILLFIFGGLIGAILSFILSIYLMNG